MYWLYSSYFPTQREAEKLLAELKAKAEQKKGLRNKNLQASGQHLFSITDQHENNIRKILYMFFARLLPF